MVIGVMLLSASTSVFALPNLNTDRNGNLCEKKHSFEYNYNFIYDKEMEIGETYDLRISFSIFGSKVTRKPYKVSVKIIPDGFKLSKDYFSLSEGDEIINLIPTKPNPRLSIKTTLILDGDTKKHRGYRATYRDKFKLNDFSITMEENSSPSTFGTIDGDNMMSKITKFDSKEIIKTTHVMPDKINKNINVKVIEPSEISWYIVRIMGIIAYVFLSLSILIAILRRINSNKFSFFLKYHCDISYLAIIFTFLHVINILGDKYEWSLGFTDLFWFDFSSKIRIMLSLGIISFYLMILIIFTSISSKIIRFLKYKNWHFVHLSSYLMYIFVIIHSLFLGTDLDASNLSNPLTLITFTIFWGFTTLNLVLLIVVGVIKVSDVEK
jgi:DMSO/TMAO reductase YedYZ heme-binding membrane subunit